MIEDNKKIVDNGCYTVVWYEVSWSSATVLNARSSNSCIDKKLIILSLGPLLIKAGLCAVKVFDTFCLYVF